MTEKETSKNLDKNDTLLWELLNNQTVTSSKGYTISAAYSSRKLENHTTIAYPVTLNLQVATVLEELQLIKVVQQTAINAYQQSFIEEEDLLKELFPTQYSLGEVKNQILELHKLGKEESLNSMDIFYYNRCLAIYKECTNNIKEYDIQSLVEKYSNEKK